MSPMNHLEFTVIVCVQLVLICVYLYSLPVMCQGSYGGVRQRRTAQGLGGNATCQCRTESATLTCSEEPRDCDEDEVSHGGSCYRFIRNDFKSRDDAHRDCIARNSHLVYIESEEEQTFLANHAESLVGNGSRNNGDVMNHYWIGLIPTSSNVWLDGNQTNNDLFEFSQDSAAGCFSVYKSSGDLTLKGENCDENLCYICELPSAECSSNDYVNHTGSCYRLSDSKMIHLSAQRSCRQDGGHLLYIESQDELQFINSSVVSNDGERYWIGLTTQYAWLDGSRAIYQGFVRTNQYSNNQGSLCFRLHPNNGFLWKDFGCGTNYAYICEREQPVISSRERQRQQHPDIPCRPPVANLNRLLDSVPLCVRSDSHYFNNYVLCQCDDNETCISGCGCARDDTVAGLKTIRCSCGFCSFTLDESEDKGYSMWPSDFSCSCSVDGTSSNVTAVNGQFTCLSDDSDSMTTAGVDRNDQPTTPVTSSTPTTVDQTGVGLPIGIPVGVTLAILFLLVALVVGFILWKRHPGEKASRIDNQLTHTVSSDTANAAPNDGGDTLLSDAVHNPALTTSVSDDPEPDETDVGYENPGKMTTSLRPDTEMHYDYAAVSRPAVELVVNSGNKEEGYVNSTMTSKIVAKDKPKPEQTNRQTAHPDDDDKRLDDTSGQSSNYVYDYAAFDNLPVGKGLSQGSHNKSPPNRGNHEPPMVHPAPPATDPGRPDSKYDDVVVGNNSEQLVVDVNQDRAYVNQKVFAKRHLGKEKQALKCSDAGTNYPPSDRSQQPLNAVITARDPPVPTDDAYAYAEIPSIVTNPSPCDSPPACYDSIAPGQSPLSDGGYQALNPAGLEGENMYTPLILEK